MNKNQLRTSSLQNLNITKKSFVQSTLLINRVHLFIVIFGVLIFLSLLRWQGIDAARMLSFAKQNSSTSEINSIRGTVYSQDGTTLSYTEPRFDIYVWYKDLEYFERLELQTRAEFLNKVAPIIDTTAELLDEKIKDNVNKGILWFEIAKSVSDDQWTKLENLKADKYENKLQGLADNNVSKRIYPEGRLAAHVVGITNKVNNKMIGVSGVEGAWNEILNPIKGIIIKESNAKGEAIATALTATVEPKNGSSIYTSINKKLQQTVEIILKEGVSKYGAESGSILILEPKTGKILTLANYPDYDPNLREEKDPEVYGNAAVSSPYEMGSIGKAITIAAAVDLGKVDAETVIMPDGHQGCEKFTDELGPLCTWDKIPQPAMSLRECFAKSDNLCLFHLAKDFMSKEEFHGYLEKFGIGKSSGVDIAGESYGPLRAIQDWTIGDVAATSYGHGYSVNAVQVATSIGIIPNNGVRMKPYLVTKVVDSDGKINEYTPEIVETVLKKDTVDKMLEMMRYNYTKAIADGEYWYYDLKNYDIGVKSGTALIADDQGYSNDINASFVGFDSSDQRTFIMVVKLVKPTKPDTLSFYNVRPLWLDTFAQVKDIIGVPRK